MGLARLTRLRESSSPLASGGTTAAGLNTDGSVACWGNFGGPRTAQPAKHFVSVSSGSNYAWWGHELWLPSVLGRCLCPSRAASRGVHLGECWGSPCLRGEGSMAQSPAGVPTMSGQATPPQGTFADVSAGVSTHLRGENRPVRRVLGRQRTRSGDPTRGNVPLRQRWEVACVWGADRPLGRLLGTEQQWRGDTAPRAIHPRERQHQKDLRRREQRCGGLLGRGQIA